MEWHLSLGLDPKRLLFHQHTKEELAHYARAAFDIQFDFGGTLDFQEIEGVHNRGDFDLGAASGVLRQEARVLRSAEQQALPAVRRRDIGRRRSHGAGGARQRVQEEKVEGEDEGRTVLGAASGARADQGGCVSAREEGRHAGVRRRSSRTSCASAFPVFYDESGAIGRRYRRQDEVGTPVLPHRSTVRRRRTAPSRFAIATRSLQERVAADRVASIIRERLSHDAGEPIALARSLREGGEAFMEEISREYYLAHSGQKPTAGAAADLREARRGRRRRRARADARGVSGQRAAGREEHRSARAAARLAGRVAERAASSRRSTSARSPGKARRSCACRTVAQIKFEAMAIEIANNPRRATIGTRSRRRAPSSSAPSWRRFAASGFSASETSPKSSDLAPSYNATFELLSGISLERAARRVRAVSARHAVAVGRGACRSSSKRVLGMTAGEATRADALALFRAREFDSGFPAIADGGVDSPAGARDGHRSARGRTHHARHRRARGEALARFLRAGARAGRGVSRAAPARRADRIGARSCTSSGHALHFAYMRPDLPFEYRWLGDNSITEGYAMLFDHLIAGRGVAQALHRAAHRACCRRSSARRASRSCTSCDATRRS